MTSPVYPRAMILYQYPGGDGVSSVSPPCLKVELALRLTEIPHRVENCRPADAARVSVTGRLPVLELTDGTRVCDSCGALDAIERVAADGALGPVDPAGRARDRVWEHFGTDTLYWIGHYMRWLHPEWSKNFQEAVFGRMPWLLRIVARPTYSRQQRLRSRRLGIGAQPPEVVLGMAERAFDLVAAALGEGPFLDGRERPGRGDLAVAAVLAQAGFRDTMPGIRARIEAREALPRYTVRVLETCGARAPRWLEGVRSTSQATS